jgi:hypothetical protein
MQEMLDAGEARKAHGTEMQVLNQVDLGSTCVGGLFSQVKVKSEELPQLSGQSFEFDLIIPSSHLLL